MSVSIIPSKGAPAVDSEPRGKRLYMIAAGALLLAAAAWWYARPSDDAGEPPKLRAITKLEQKKDTRALVAALKDQDPEVAARAAQALGTVGDKTVYQAYAPALNDSRPQVREAAIRSYAYIADSTQVAPLVTAAQTDREPAVRAAAAESIGRLRSMDGANALLKGLSDPDEGVRQASIAAIGNICQGVKFPKYDSSKRTGNEAAIAAIQKYLRDFTANVELDKKRTGHK
jgi:HEAT repeat protein